MKKELGAIVRGSESAFPREEYANRIAAARATLAARGLDALVLTGPENIFYLTGQQTPGYYTFQCLILPLEGEGAAVPLAPAGAPEFPAQHLHRPP